ncbi:MAG: M20/M25/M40 family metallo-hydrolase [Acidobacteria bacterium]|nr:M20/M25/M40 family metallo-hydrolase [Acidobacteriota bacterium]
MRIISKTIAALVMTSCLWAADPVTEYVSQRHQAILKEFAALVEIPNVTADLPNVRRNAEAIRRMFEQRGIPTRLLTIKDYAPIVFGEIKTPGATRTVNFYAHYDGMPVDPSEWINKQPFLAELRDTANKPIPLEQTRYNPEWRLYNRASADDKAPIMAMAIALDAIKALGLKHKSNIRFFFEGEEEAGSTHLTEYLEAHKDLVKGDLWLICDGPLHQNRQQSVVFGVRGVTSLNLTVYGPKRGLHSGHYGGWVPNPNQRMVRLLSTFTDGEGHILVKDFYKGIIPFNASELAAITKIPNVEEMLKEELGLAETEGDGKRLFETYSRPTLNLRGVGGGGIGKTATNVIPAEANATLDIRLVKGLDWKTQVDRVRAHIVAQGYLVLDREPTDAERRKHAKIAKLTAREGYNSVRTPLDLPIVNEVVKIVESVTGPVVLIPSHGGSVPLAMFEEVTKMPLVMVPIVNHDNNQHAPNENLRLQNLWDGIRVMTALLANL